LTFASAYWHWRGNTGRRAWRLAVVIIGLILLNLVVNLGLNQWHRWFFDTLERREAAQLIPAVMALAGLIISGAAFAVAMVYCQMTLQLGWRRWVTGVLIASWDKRSNGEGLSIDGEADGSPQFRIAEDVRLALDPIVELSIGFLNAIVLATMFLSILIVVGGGISFQIASLQVTLPAYLALAALAYAVGISAAMLWIGQPLVQRVAEKNEAEALFLFELTKATQLSDGGGRTHLRFRKAKTAFLIVVASWRRVIREHCKVTWLSNSSIHLSPLLPLVLAAPKYFSGEFSLGTMMQLSAAFAIVVGALNWLTENYVRLAEWAASARRVAELQSGLAEDEQESSLLNGSEVRAPGST
jgi:vitamin B12/bleomycin/antimicrobial peptide transport system ATP-binding/permease protein